MNPLNHIFVIDEWYRHIMKCDECAAELSRCKEGEEIYQKILASQKGLET